MNKWEWNHWPVRSDSRKWRYVCAYVRTWLRAYVPAYVRTFILSNLHWHMEHFIVLRINSEMVIIWATTVIVDDWRIREVRRERKINRACMHTYYVRTYAWMHACLLPTYICIYISSLSQSYRLCNKQRVFVSWCINEHLFCTDQLPVLYKICNTMLLEYSENLFDVSLEPIISIYHEMYILAI